MADCILFYFLEGGGVHCPFKRFKCAIEYSILVILDVITIFAYWIRISFLLHVVAYRINTAHVICSALISTAFLCRNALFAIVIVWNRYLFIFWKVCLEGCSMPYYFPYESWSLSCTHGLDIFCFWFPRWKCAAAVHIDRLHFWASVRILWCMWTYHSKV